MSCVRHELTHDLPASNLKASPDRLAELAKLNLVLTTPARMDIHPMLQTRLQSYDLLYWCWETVEQVVAAIEQASGESSAIGMTGSLFTEYKQWVPSPESIEKMPAQALEPLARRSQRGSR